MITEPTQQKHQRFPTADKQPRHRFDLAALAARLTDRDRWLLAMLHEHHVLTSHQITALAFTSGRIGRRRLLELYRYSVINRFTPRLPVGTAPAHYILDTAGAAVLAAEHGIEPKELGWRRDRAIAISHSLRLAHTLGVNEWFISLATRAVTHPGANTGTLVTWWSQTRCQHLWGDLTRPDGYGRWAHPTGEIEFFLEFDLATERLGQVADKLTGYAELARTSQIITPVLLWLPTHRRETNARHALSEAASALDDPHAVPIATAAADLLDPTSTYPSAADRVWLPLDRPSDTGRLELHELSTAWPRLTIPPTPTTEDPTPSLHRRRVLPPPTPTPPSHPKGR